MSDQGLLEEFPDRDQRVSICYNLWATPAVSEGPGGHIPDGSGPNGLGNGSGNGLGNGQGLNPPQETGGVAGKNETAYDTTALSTLLKPTVYQLRPVGSKPFNLKEIKDLFNGNVIAAEIPGIYVQSDELIKTGSCDKLDIKLQGVSGELAGILKAKILSYFPETLRDRICINSWCSDTGEPPYGSYVSVGQYSLLGYNGVPVVSSDDMYFSEYANLEIGAKYSAPKSKVKQGFTTKRIETNMHKIAMFQSGNDIAYFSGIAMTPGTFNGDTFDADVLEASLPYWAGVPLTLNHEDESDPYTTILGRVLKAWWDKEFEQLWVQAIVETPTTVEMLNKKIYPAMSPKLDLYISVETGKIVEIVPVHLSLLIDYDPANPTAGVVIAG